MRSGTYYQRQPEREFFLVARTLFLGSESGKCVYFCVMASTENDDAAVIPPPKNSGQCHLNLLNKNVVSNVMGVEKSVQDAHPFSRKKTKLFRNQKNIGL